jgi:hypothetical protein
MQHQRQVLVEVGHSLIELGKKTVDSVQGPILQNFGQKLFRINL